MEFLLLIGVLLLFVFTTHLSGRIKKLERALGERGRQTAATPAVPLNPAELSERETPRERRTTEFSPHGGPDWSDQLIAWLKEDWLLKLGALLLLIGFGWLVTYAFLNNWIGPVGRVTLGIFAGTVILLLGWWRMQRFLQQGSVFLVLGSTVILLTIYAARLNYDFFTPLSALAMMLLASAFVAFASVQYRIKTLALTSLILAGAAPLLTASPSSDYTGLFAYLFVVTLGVLWIVMLTGWRELTAASLILIGLYSAPHLLGGINHETDTLLLFAYAFAGIFFIFNTVGIVKSQDKDPFPDLITAAGNGLFLLAWIELAAPDEWKSLLIAAWMVIFVVGAFLTYRATGKREPFFTYAGIGVAMLAAATAAELEGPMLTIAYTIESALVILTVYLMLRDKDLVEKVGVILIGPAALSLQSIVSPSWASGVIHDDFFVLLVMTATLLGLGIYFSRFPGTDKRPSIGSVLLGAGSIYAFITWWLVLHAWFDDKDTATMTALTTYTLIGLAAYFYGTAKNTDLLKKYGAVLLGFVVIRLLLIDVWNMELTGRIITFFLVGALLMSTAFYGRKQLSKPASEQ